MKLHQPNKFWVMISLLVVAALACQGGGGVEPVVPQPPQQTPTPQTQPNNGTPDNILTSNERINLMSATVQIYALFNENGERQVKWTGSGTILSRTGLILTNAHVAAPTTQGESADPDALAIALVQSEDKPPVFSYLAEVRAADGYLDFAVIQITSTIDGSTVDPNSLSLPFVTIGNSDNVHVGDHINIFGFPGIGGDTITYTDGNVSGFTSENQLGDRAWIKTDATIAGGNSGGLAASDNAEIIGVPTIASSGAEGSKTLDCRPYQDTNGDGQFNEEDICVPVGGFINGVRPVNLALPLIKAAQSGQQYSSPFGSGQITSSGGGSESFGNITWYSVSGGSACTLEQPLTSYPSNTVAMAAAFDFSGMTDGQEWAELWTVDGQEIYSGKYAWTEGETGQTYTCIYANEGSLPDGNYRLQLFAGPDLPQLAESSVTVGGSGSGAVVPPPTSSGVTLSGTVTDADTGNPIANAAVFVLVPGVSYDAWSGNNYPDSDVYTYAMTDSNGYYKMPYTISRGESYTIVASAQGYYDRYGDNLVWTDQDPDQYQMDIQMTK